ncbi:MAG TPA: thrombospondin type 3 repeat-containing protein [Polyangiaceae bacterium]|nr:thrombospondin type 3 repeat-containing protein [Polyangiaceae bacterium]
MRRVVRRLALALLALSSSAQAEVSVEGGRGLDLHLFRPPVDPDGYLSTNGTDCMRAGTFGLRLTLDAGFRLLPADSVSSGTLALNWAIWQRLVAGVSLPVQHVRAPGEQRFTGVGDVELAAKYGFLSARPGDLQNALAPGLAGVVRVSLPTGKPEEFRGSPGVTVWPTVVLDIAPLPFLRFGAEAGYRFISGQGARVTLSDGRHLRYDDLVTLGLAGKVVLGQRVALLADWYAAAVARSLTERDAISTEVSLGARFQLTSFVSLTVGGAVGAPRGLLGSTGRGFLSVVVAAADADLDGDGYPTRDDACPDSAEDFDHFEDSDGCPDDDNDEDGLADAVDTCPNDFGTRAGAGCPLRSIDDADRDGVSDYLDACPDVAAPGTRDGCPKSNTGGSP